VHRQSQLLEVIAALHTACRLARGLHGRQQKRHKNSNNGNDYQQFHERETATSAR